MLTSDRYELWLQWGAVIGASLVAAITDLRQGRIPNWLTLPLWLLGLAKATDGGGAAGFVGALGVSVLLVMLGAIEYGWLFFNVQQITNAARQGARVAILPDGSPALLQQVLPGDKAQYNAEVLRKARDKETHRGADAPAA